MKSLKKIIPKSFVAQVIAVVLLTLLMAQLLSVLVLWGVHKSVVSDVNRLTRFQQVESLVELLENSPKELYPAILAASRTRYAWYTLSHDSKINFDGDSRVERRLRGDLERLLGKEYKGNIRVKADQQELDKSFDFHDCDDDDCYGSKKYYRGHGRKFEYRQQEEFKKASRLISLQVAVKMQNGLWLNLRASAPSTPLLVARHTVPFLLIFIVLVMLVLFIMLRRITKPLKGLAEASKKLGIGEQVEPLPELGPRDIRETIQAFNQMNQRLQRFVSDRTRMLAALSHDLRTPITTMGLRVEMMPESRDRDHLLNTLDEMQQMSEATLAFMRQASDNEQTRQVELNAMLDTLCEDYLELGKNVQYTEADETIISCRPVSMKRALRNLIDNAVKYGERASVSLSNDEEKVRIIIEDNGPGIPESQMEKVFEPFFRLEESRNRDTGGIGLGMAIARNIIRNHGGDIRLENTREGLKVIIDL